MSKKNTEELVISDEVSETSDHWTINIPKPRIPKFSPKNIAIGVGIAVATTLGVVFLGKHYDHGFDDEDWSEEISESSEDDVFESSED